MRTLIALSALLAGCYRAPTLPAPPEAPEPSCPGQGVLRPEEDPEGRVDLAYDLGGLSEKPIAFCGAVGNRFDDGWLVTLAGPSVLTLQTPFCDCTYDGPHFEAIPVDPAPEVVGAGGLFTDEVLDAMSPLPLGPGVWMLRMFDSGDVDLDYVAEVSAVGTAGRSLRTDAPSDFLGAPLVGGQLSGWTGYPVDASDIVLVQITQEKASLRFSELTGRFLTVSLATDENNDGRNDQEPLQSDRVDEAGQAVTYEVEPGFYYLEIFGGPAVYTIDFEEGFGIGAPF